ncbi:ATPase [Oceanicola sp. 22II-s10i]|uniref:ATP12 family chaperone protein n=1 Tax=Oceanicola sp. 22II-s10i TaxID=1317116 RepID=UPI000B524E70|nr:ATP12 family protein [Oceanicola sp. 22II-s10i]OWU84009.1 ATPase [Oceanicola sp. 22II-s10i]
MTEWKAKRFWKSAGVVPAGDGFTVELDGRPVRTPGKSPLILPSRAMAELIAAEWDAQDTTIDPNSMPATRAANSAIEKVATQFDAVAEMLAAYGDADLLCYRAEAPHELVQRQAEAWDPLLDWAAEVYGARLEARTGLMHEPQDPEALARLDAEVRRLSSFELTAFHDLVSLSGSLVIGLAAARDHRPADDLWTLSRLDELWQEELWGADEEAAEVAEIKRQAFLNAKQFFDLSRIDP